MTDPNNVRDLVNFVIDKKEITAITYFSDSLWVGTKSGDISVMRKDNDPKRGFKIQNHFGTAKLNYKVQKLIPIENPKCIIAHYTTQRNDPGPVDVIRPGAIRNRLLTDASIVATSFTKVNPKISLINHNQVHIYQFIGDVLIPFDSFEVANNIINADMTDDSIVYAMMENRAIHYFQYYLKEKTTKCIATAIAERALVHSISKDSCAICFKEFLNYTGSKDNLQGEQVKYPTEKGNPNFLYGTKEIIYQFYKDNFFRVAGKGTQTFEISDVRLATFIDKELLVVTENNIKIIGSVPPPKSLAADYINGKAANVIQTLKSLSDDQASDVMKEIFAILWGQNKLEPALDLAGQFLWSQDPSDLFGIFPDLMIEGAKRRRIVKEGPTVPISERALYEKLSKVLIFTRDGYQLKGTGLERAHIRRLNTAIAECYALLSRTRELDTLLKENIDQISIEKLKEFIVDPSKNNTLGPAFGVFLTRTGEIEKAIGIWRQLNAFKPDDELFPVEASFTIRECRNSDLLSTTLEWLYSINPRAAVNGLLSPYHDTDLVLGFLSRNHLQRERVMYLDFICQLPGFSPRPDLLNECFAKFIQILGEIQSSNFDLSAIEFTKAYANRSSTSDLKAAVVEELTNKSISILEEHSDAIDAKACLDLLTPSIDRRIRFAIFRVTGRYQEAIEIMLKDFLDGKEALPPFDELQEFCRQASDSPAAFTTVFKALPPTKLFAEEPYTSFITRNLEFLSPVDVIALIPRDTKITKQLTNIVRILYNLLVHRTEGLDKQMAISRALDVDADYRVAEAESVYTTVEESSKCEACKGKIINNFKLAPTGELYHVNDAPKL